MSYDDEDRKDHRRKKMNKKQTSKHKYNDGDFSYSKIKNQFKQKKRHLKEKDILDDLEDYR